MDPLVDALTRSIPEEVKTISRVLKEHGHRSWIVGGCVRDVALALLQKRDPQVVGDWDLASDARPEQVQKSFRKVIPTGIQHGTVTVVLNREHFEVTTLRGEKGHTDGRRPDEVFFVDDLKEDLARRDFTINAMAFSVTEEEFFDPFLGREDLNAGLIRAVGEPSERFSEDGLRVLRCARFCATLGLEIEEETKKAISPSLSSFEKVAQERVSDEWFKALRSKAPSRFFRAIIDHGMLAITFDEIWSSSETFRPLDQALSLVDAGAAEDPLYRLALFVRCGTAREADPGAVAQRFATRLRFSKDQTTRLARLCKHADLPPDVLAEPSGYSGRKWLGTVGRSEAMDVLGFQAHLAEDSTGAETSTRARDALKSQLESGHPLTLKELPVTGGDLIQHAGIAKGPQLGAILGQLLEAVLQDPKKNDREVLLNLAREASLR